MTATPDISRLPEPLRARVAQQWSEWTGGALAPETLEQLPRVWGASAFVAQLCLREPQVLLELEREGLLGRADAEGEVLRRVTAATDADPEEKALMRSLRRCRKREMLRIAWRDLAGLATLDETLTALSDLADAAIECALARIEPWLAGEHGRPADAREDAPGLIVLAMGKLGGRELNFSSDIDLIFACEAHGDTRGARPLSAEEYFGRLARALVRVLSEHTADGFVFRVDTLLRPFGKSGPLVMHRDAVEQYYQTHGRAWERYALIKARPAAGDRAAGAKLLADLRPFVYRRYLDYSAFESMREMKGLIEQQLHRKGYKDNIKLGAGGIREVEFVAQAFQLIRGGHEPVLQQRALLPVLARLEEGGLLPAFAVRDLREAYVLLRRTENRLQAWRDQQTHDLPADDEPRAALALAMGFPDWAAFHAELQRQRRKVHQQFEQVFVAPHTRDPDARFVEELGAIWEEAIDDGAALAILRRHGLRDATATLEFLHQMRQSPLYRGLSEAGRRRLSQLLPLLFGAVESRAQPDVVLLRVLSVIEAIAGRVTYLALLVESPMALSQLVSLCEASPWITQQIARHPLLLDELLDPRSLYRPPGRADLEQELSLATESLKLDDLEAQMDVLRRMRQAWTLRVAAADVSGHMPLMVVSDHLTWMAEVIVRHALAVAWTQMVQRHGRPLGTGGAEAGFAIVGYGKLGGLELGYGSDLDLVFIHDGAEGASTDGERPLDHGSFFTRLGQKIIHILSARMPSGIAYEVDLQLRPSGNSGLLVTSLGAFHEYQLRHAWTWEHQALVRARAFAGSERLMAPFEAVRQEVLCRPRDSGVLREEIRSMRSKMRGNLDKAPPGRFDLKQGAGGIIDIEFLVQYLVLREAARVSALVRYSDNIRQLEALSESGILAAADAALLADAYRAYRKRIHALALQEQPGIVDDDEFADYRREVARLWVAMIESGAGA